jgi:hypothetical protein
VTSVRRYVEQAEIHGARAVWALACQDGLSGAQLLDLQARLRSLDPPKRRATTRKERATDADLGGWVEVEPRFQLRPKERCELALRLMVEGVADGRRVRTKLGISKATWWRIRRNFEATDHPTSEDPTSGPDSTPVDTASNAGSPVSKRANPTRTLLPPPRLFRPAGMPASLCGLCPARHVEHATARATEVGS